MPDWEWLSSPAPNFTCQTPRLLSLPIGKPALQQVRDLTGSVLWGTLASTASRLVWPCCRRLEIPSNLMLNSCPVTCEGTEEQESGRRKHTQRATPLLSLLHFTSVLDETRGTTGQRVPSRLGEGRHRRASARKEGAGVLEERPAREFRPVLSHSCYFPEPSRVPR